MKTALVHDYLTQRGGAERVVLLLSRALPDAPIYTSLYEPSSTFPEFETKAVRTLPLNGVAALRSRHRLSLPLLAPAFSQLRVDADVAICSSSGWAHGARVTGRKIVYCYTPARWLYQTATYLGSEAQARLARPFLRPLIAWDRRAAASAATYLVTSRAVQARVKRQYGVDADIVPPPPALTPAGPAEAVPGVGDGFFLCVSRLLPYKNVGPVVAAFRQLPNLELVIAGTGPLEGSLRSEAPPNVRFVGVPTDPQLRWLYSRACGVIAASREDYGLTPLEAAAFGRPAAVLDWGGFLDTVVEGETGTFFGEPEPPLIADAVKRLVRWDLPEERLTEHVARFSEERFIARISDAVHCAAASL